ncbi:hypothetical protein H0H92_011649 [Tricholoma furcatifolium]|nr:hypothetical protein H0H92_011649 [Tricholoma furcatifolium]
MMLGPRTLGEPYEFIHPGHSTKQMVSRYESLSNASHAPTYSSFDGTAKNDKSPIRQSFRNLFSALKKVNLRKGKHIERPLSSFKKQHHPIINDHPGLNAPPVFRSRSRKLTSSLLYLSGYSQLQGTPDTLMPVWSSCTATLEPDSIVISGLTPHGNPSVHIIELSNCTNVRSLPIEQLNPEESALLPRKGGKDGRDEFKVFEILFEGRPREKFAANSVQERAGWVSAIWDAVIPSRDEEDCIQKEDSLADLISSEEQVLRSVLPVLNAPTVSQRPLPPTPLETLPPLMTSTVDTYSQASCPPISPSIYPPTQPVSRASSAPGQSRSSSPSIANLSRLSVVRQRLAQMEMSSSSLSSSPDSPVSSRLSVCTRLTTPVLAHEAKLSTSQIMARNKSARSGTADSIFDSYCDRPIEPAPLPSFFEKLEDNFAKTQTVENQRSRSTRGQSSHAPPNPDSTVEYAQSDKGYDQPTANLDGHILSLRDEIYGLPGAVANVVNVQGCTNAVLKRVAELEEQAKSNGKALNSIQRRINKQIDRKQGDTGAEETNDKLFKAIETLQAEVKNDLAQMRTTLSHSAPSSTQMNNIPPNALPSEVDISNLHAKVEALHGTCSAEYRSLAGSLESMRKMGSLLEKDSAKLDLQSQRHSESIRYLTELNSWIEASVKHDTLQRHDLCVKIDQLCGDLSNAQGGSLMADIRQLALDTAARDQSSAILQAKMDGLLTMLNDISSESRYALTDAAPVLGVARIATLIDQQRQYQEDLVRALGTGISDEIKGERLRFVEAMKEATAINVQIHVEQFKQELKQEVMGMTEEVGRLHRDRQAMQNQIADLFAFYIKHKAAVENENLLPLGLASKPESPKPSRRDEATTASNTKQRKLESAQ